jgi:hypothetical protein
MKICTMNCGPAQGDTRTRQDRMRDCDDCDTIADAMPPAVVGVRDVDARNAVLEEVAQFLENYQTNGKPGTAWKAVFAERVRELKGRPTAADPALELTMLRAQHYDETHGITATLRNDRIAELESTLGLQALDDGLYYLQDKRTYVGNCPMWWVKDGNGYTTRLDTAHRYTKDEAFAQHRMRETDIPWPCNVVDPLERPTIDVQDLHRTDYFKSLKTRKAMKALSIQQPWAWLITNAGTYADPKLIENRSRRTSHRGPFLVHASKTFDMRGYRRVLELRPYLAEVMPKPDQFERGGFVGVASITDCVDNSISTWFVGLWGYVLEEFPQPLPFVPYKGELGFFKVDEIGMLLHPDYAPLVEDAAH